VIVRFWICGPGLLWQVRLKSFVGETFDYQHRRSKKEKERKRFTKKECYLLWDEAEPLQSRSLSDPDKVNTISSDL